MTRRVWRPRGVGTIYRFDLEAPIEVEKGDLVLLRLSHRELDCSITAVSDTTLDIVLPDDIGYAVDAGAELFLGAAWLLERLRSRVSAAFEVATRAPSHFNLPGALLTLGLGEIHISPVGPTPQYENERRPLNEEQERAISTAFRSPLTIVTAAAGTGKTVTLGATVEAFAADDERWCLMVVATVNLLFCYRRRCTTVHYSCATA